MQKGVEVVRPQQVHNVHEASYVLAESIEELRETKRTFAQRLSHIEQEINAVGMGLYKIVPPEPLGGLGADLE